MDPVTHFLTGACLGRAGFNRKTAYATLAMTLAAEAPDVDVVAAFGGPVFGFCHHRGFTHTLVGAPLMALAVTGVVWSIAALRSKLGRPPLQPVRWVWVWLLALVADFSHLFLDYTNNYGLRPFFPFDAHWYAWSTVFIFEPVLFAVLVLGLIVPALLGLVEGEMRRRQPGQLRGRSWAIAALVGAALLYTVRGAEHAHAIRLVEQAGSLANTREPLLRLAAEPVMGDPFTWHVLAETQSGYQSAVVRTLHDNVDPGDVTPKRPVTAAVAAAKASYLGRVYGDWSSWPLTEDLGSISPPGDMASLPPGAHTVLFRDLRFAPEALGPLAGEGGTNPVLSGFVVVGDRGAILSQWMSGRQQH
jgi:inner membrane protein